MRYLMEQDPVMDMQVLLGSLRIVDAEGDSLFPAMLAQFKENSWQILSCLGENLERKDLGALAHTLYVFKGSAHLMGATRLERMSDRLRRVCLEGFMPSNAEWNELVGTLDEFVDTVQRFHLVYTCRA